MLGDHHEIDEARANLVRVAGTAAAVRAFATAGNFQMMNRLLDGLGVGPHERFLPLAAEIGVTVPDHFAT